MKRTVIVGAGQGGSALMNILQESPHLQICGVADVNEEAEGMKKARQADIAASTDWQSLLDRTRPDVVIETTGNDEVLQSLQAAVAANVAVIPSSVAYIIHTLIEDKKELIDEVQKQELAQATVLDSTHDGMIAINRSERIILFNHAAEEMTGDDKTERLGAHIHEVLPESRLPRVLETGKVERNQSQTFENGQEIVTTRVPLYRDDTVVGALAVFKDVTEIVRMAEEVTNLKSIQQMLEAIIQSSEEAISVVDENGMGIMINPAYSKLTGLKKEDVIGKPATADIYEGESMHLQVLKTKEPVRGVRLKVGPKRKDVVVNVAPVVVDGDLKGSVGIIHDVSEIKALTEELERARQIIRTLEAKYTFADIVGYSEGIRQARAQAEISASTPVTVLLRGESGTGKELFAHAIHDASSRRFGPFIRVNCAALSESLLESELFGYEEGAFSGAVKGGKRGLFEEADQGSIFLDEIGEMSAKTQVKLLRVLQEGEIVRVGGTKTIAIDARIIAATNVDLEEAVQTKSFREDLYYRLNKMPIMIPSLRERLDDLEALCHHLLRKINQEYGRQVEGLSSAAIEYLSRYDWPGNVRELENILGRAVIHMDFSATNINKADLPALTSHDREPPEVYEEEGSLQEQLEAFERQQLVGALARTNGNKTEAAKSLQISIRNLYYKLEKHQIDNSSMQ
ncbi:sigma 54-interacting transcriptional regulator [Salsuginibacillus kocurii]|uniref:sigma 54-interacting transcriptional regulator n=1 Tax=Salsuginibacillus kocurii TaxID=427078 RepID=UPI0004761C70|nr:sigma-54-dependent Fis family transcriptional regulator [Salsuginibacillus kocurii]